MERQQFSAAPLTAFAQFGFDFTVRGTVNITSVLVFASNGVLATSKDVTIFDRSSDAALLRLTFDAGSTSQSGFTSTPTGMILQPGVYSILVRGTAIGIAALEVCLGMEPTSYRLRQRSQDCCHRPRDQVSQAFQVLTCSPLRFGSL
jgi:hypothetical protein